MVWLRAWQKTREFGDAIVLSNLTRHSTLDLMTSRIQPLPTEVVHLIGAGEVIDSLAAAVRELVENALDAAATRITLSLWPEQWRLRLVDNGRGMSLADLQQAATPHSTSKIRHSHDLWHITSLGFRGEALHSLAQLADLQICSRSQQGDEGWQVCYGHDGEPLQLETVAIAPGTVVTVDRLFAPWPARRLGIPSFAQQLRQVQTTIQQMALCHPHVTWLVEQNDREWFAIWPGETARSIVPQLLRDVQPGDLQDLRLTLPHPRADAQVGPAVANLAGPSGAASLYLLVGLPDRCHRHRPDWVRVAINGRVVQVPPLEQVLIGAFRRMLPRDRHPVCFLHLQVAADQIDWNRAPAKTQLYLHHLTAWQAQVKQALQQVLQTGMGPLPEAESAHRAVQVVKTAEAAGAYGYGRTIQPAATEAAPLVSLRAIAQVHQTYILAEHSGGIWLIEQHIAHERVLYEQLGDRWQMVPLNPPIILSQLTASQVEQLLRLGLELDAFGDDLWAIRTAPEPLAARSDCPEALQELSLGGSLDAALVATACRTAIRNGTPLSLSEMQMLLDQWQQTRHPHTCPHGRPICLTLEESSLARFFRRHWVIGKSHGI